MRTKVEKSVYWAVSAAATLALLPVSMAALAHDVTVAGGKPIVLKVEAGALRMVAPASECLGHASRPNFTEFGCLRFSKNTMDSVKFTLPPGGNADCDPGIKWELDGVQLGGMNQDSKPAWSQIMPVSDAQLQLDFDVDPGTGWVSYTPVANGISIVNKNMTRYGYTVWYRVRASCPGKPMVNPIYFDPRMDNEGND